MTAPIRLRHPDPNELPPPMNTCAMLVTGLAFTVCVLIGAMLMSKGISIFAHQNVNYEVYQ